jgi:hypothetical protein
VLDFRNAGKQTAVADDDDARRQIRVFQAQANLRPDPCRFA